MAPDAVHNAVLHALVSAPRIEYGVAIGTGESRPRISWTIHSDCADWTPDSYEITLWLPGEAPQTAMRQSDDQVFVEWPFAPLASRQRFEVSVRIGLGGLWSRASERGGAEVGLLEQELWSAQFITPETIGGLDDAAPVVFTDFELPSAPRFARLYVTARGLYEFSINDRKVGDDVLTPGWTSYDKRIRYQTYDVTDQLRSGVNSLRAVLGNGWYRGQLVWPGNRSSYGTQLALLAQLEVTLDDGRVVVFATDASWRAAASGILFDDLYDGQTRDLRIPGDPTGRRSEGVMVLERSAAELVAPTAPTVGVTETVHPVSIGKSPAGALLVDFGQNLVGWVRLAVHDAKPGDVVIIRHAEVLEDDELGVRPLRSAKATSTYVLAGGDEEILLPTFTFHGFRYAEITGVVDLRAADVRAVVLGSKLRRTGWFDSSDERLNQLHRNVVWSMRGNFVDLPTDCPARDERLGWTGDIQVFAPTANYLYDTSGFLSGWLRDLAADQKPDGGVPNVIPDVLREADPASAAWGDAATIVPSALFDAFADRSVIARQYDSMVAWVEKVTIIAGPGFIWDSGDQFGDWLDPTAPPDNPARAQADPAVVATAHFARSTYLLAKASDLLGLTGNSARYRERYRQIVSAFNREFVTDEGEVQSDCQTVYALVLEWNLLDSESKRDFASARIAELVRAAGCRVSTGFVGTPLILDALQTAGHVDLAMKMLLQEESPSWLYAVNMGATTIWERWDSMLPDGSINSGSMTSFNHYAYGAVADWMHRSIAGLEALEPGFKRIRVRPSLAGNLTAAHTRHESPFGIIDISWKCEDGVFTLDVDVPFGVTAEVCVPGEAFARQVGRGIHTFSAATPTTLGGR